MTLSHRLLAIANLITPGIPVADVGCDHGYLAIYLISYGISPRVIAMDINRGPLERAREHVSESGLTDSIELRLSDGLKELSPGEGKSIVMAGMGGPLMISIMEASPEVCREAYEFILQPQSEISGVRHYLEDNGYCIIEEDLVSEDGKFYPMMKVVHGRMKLGREVYYKYGKHLLEISRHPVSEESVKQEYSEPDETQPEETQPVMLRYLMHERTQLLEIKDALLNSPESDRVDRRLQEVDHELEIVEEAFARWEDIQ